MSFHSVKAKVFLLFLILLISGVIILDTCYPISLNPTQQQFIVVITAEDGTPLRTFADMNGVWRYPIKLDQVSPLYLQALINYEDKWFWYHPGVNIISIVRAFVQNFSHSKIISGGSTLTMQVARLITPHKKSISGKIKQILIALQLEWHFSKEQILVYYLNHAPFGGTIEGIQAASYAYLNKPASELSHAEAALLAVLPQAPSRNRPDRHPERARIVRNKVLKRMAKQFIWPQQDIQQAYLEPIIINHKNRPLLAPLLARRLKNQFKNQHIITTSIDFNMQQSIEEQVKNYSHQFPEKTSIAVLVVDNKTLLVKTYIGSANFLDHTRFGHVDMIKAIRSPGSTLKPFLYGMALDKGLIHSESLLIDAPLTFNGYKPQNFSRGFSGSITASNALKRSLNIPAVQLLYHLKPKIFVSSLRNSGLNLLLNNHAKSNLSVILGGVGTNLESLVGSYTALANKGQSGKIRYTKNTPLSNRYLLSEGAAWIIYEILSTQNTLAPTNLAWKTGTSYGHRDSWSIGVTPSYTIGIWIGRPDGTPLPGHYGAQTATPLLFSITEKMKQMSRILQPTSVVKQQICWPLGSLKHETSIELCHETKQAWVLNNQIPKTLPDLLSNSWQSNPVTVQINAETGHIVNQTCKVKQIIEKEIALWPLATEPWISNKFKRSEQFGLFDSSCTKPIIYAINEIKIKGLERNTKLRSAGASTLLPKIELNAIGGQGKYYWFINAKLIYTVDIDKTIYHQFEDRGKYQLTVMDESGKSDSVNIDVI